MERYLCTNLFDDNIKIHIMVFLLKARIVKPARKPFLQNGSVSTPVARQQLSSCHMKVATSTHTTLEELLETELSVRSVLSLYITKTSYSLTRVEAGSNTSTVNLRVVGGDEKGSLKSEMVKYGPNPKGLGPEKDYTGEGQQHVKKTVSSSLQRGRPTKTRP
jgi:hypothetical protein